MKPRSLQQTVAALMRGIIACPICGRSGGHLREDHLVCEVCRSELAPTKLMMAREGVGWSVDELAEAAGVTTMTVHRALRGERLGKASAKALSKVTGVPIEVLRAGERSPFYRPRAK